MIKFIIKTTLIIAFCFLSAEAQKRDLSSKKSVTYKKRQKEVFTGLDIEGSSGLPYSKINEFSNTDFNNIYSTKKNFLRKTKKTMDFVR